MSTALAVQEELDFMQHSTALFKQLEEGQQTDDKGAVIDAHFTELAMRMEHAGDTVSLPKCRQMSALVKKEFLPKYLAYERRKNEILAQSHSMKLWKYIVFTIVFLNVLEFIFTRGMSLRPQALFVMLVPEGILGSAVFGIVKLFYRFRISGLRRRLFNSLEGKDQHLKLLETHTAHREVFGEIVQEAEALHIFHQYVDHFSFFTDFRLLVRMDPTTPHDFDELNLPQFEDFIARHLEDAFTLETRKQRFTELYLHAQKYYSQDFNFITS